MDLQINLGERSYAISVQNGLIKALEQVKEIQQCKKMAIVTDENVFAIYSKYFPTRADSKVICLPAGEESKSFGYLQQVWDDLVKMRADRKTLLVVIGGGVVGDLGGFAASTYMRGIPFIQIPTTLLSQVDSSVGGKTGINHPQGKNLIGAFYQPNAVYIDTDVLRTLPSKEFLAGLGEVVKYGVIWDRDFFNFLLEHHKNILDLDTDILNKIVLRCCAIKAEVVEKDERESDLRAILNYGHSVAHGLENVCAYHGVLHGQAVAFGMDVEMIIARNRKMVTEDEVVLQRELLKKLQQNFQVPKFNMEHFFNAILLDKKNQDSHLTFILPTKIGEVKTVRDIRFDEIEKAVQESLASGLFA